MDTFSPEILIPLVESKVWLLLFTLPGLLLYGCLTDRVVFEGGGRVRSERFAGVDGWVAAFLVLLFSSHVLSQLPASGGKVAVAAKTPDAAATIALIVFGEIIFLGIAAAPLIIMKMRDISLRESFGVTRLGVGGVFGAASVLLVFAFPLIAAALELSRVLLAGAGYHNTEPQDLVRFLAENRSWVARIAVAISAMIFAPFQEELIFRGYLYGVARRYIGPAGGTILVSLLFAAIHVHAPSFAGLFVLAVCLTLAYEWTGSLLVPMTMHALFNSFTVINLLAGGPAQG